MDDLGIFRGTPISGNPHINTNNSGRWLSPPLGRQETPTAYIMWRFAGNDDRESLEFKTDELSVDEEKAGEDMWSWAEASGKADFQPWDMVILTHGKWWF